MSEYYSTRLSAEQLERCYKLAPPRILRYLQAELDFVADQVGPFDLVLELGCGYGRVLNRICREAGDLVGIDVSGESLEYAVRYIDCNGSVQLSQMNAVSLAFDDDIFDVVFCIQNGISAFGVDPTELVRESLRVTRPNGFCLFSSYSDKIWEERLEWFSIQSEAGLVGEIDWTKTEKGLIVCKDGFTATTFREDDFRELAIELEFEAHLIEIDESSLFCCIEKGT
ncbi:MAG: methyltransferase domain-containing protein [Candidatus Thorarchaeota archaeon]|nr:MAG: methyltransferase domain-containing protein [Candidatus Thorarchaeota archaeon]